MDSPQERYDAAMLSYSRGDYSVARLQLEALLVDHPDHFEACLALGMACSRLGDHEAALREGHRAEHLRPDEPLAHTNLSVFHMKAGNKEAAEQHAQRARILSWKENLDGASGSSGGSIGIASPRPAPIRLPGRFPDMPWKKK